MINIYHNLKQHYNHSLWLGLIGLFCLLLNGCQTYDPYQVGYPSKSAIQQQPLAPIDQADPHKVRIGLLLPLTGSPLSPTAIAIKEAAEMAVFEKTNQNFELVVRDTKGTQNGAIQAFQELSHQNVKLVLGPFFSSSVTAITPYALQSAIPVISFSNSSNVARSGIFIMGYTPEQEIFRVVEYARAQGIETFGVIAPNTPYGHVAVNALRDASLRFDAKTTEAAFYNPLEDPTPVLKKFRFQEVDALLLPDTSQNLTKLTQLITEIKPQEKPLQLLGTRLWEHPKTTEQTLLHQSWFATNNLEGWKYFEARYTNLYHKRPPRLAILGYDAVALAATLANWPGGADFSLARICDPSGFKGIDGNLRFLPNGMSERQLSVFEITPQGFQEIAGAFNSFL